MKCVAGTRKLLTNLKLASMVAGGAPYGLVEDAAVAVEAGRIAWAGARADLPRTMPAGRCKTWLAGWSRRA
jgi:imidazolonepropionase-like amidohydrolase